MGICESIIRHAAKLEEAETESALLRERVRELEISREQERRQHLQRLRSDSDLEDASTLIHSPETGPTLSPTSPFRTSPITSPMSPSSMDPTHVLLEMEGQLEFLEGQRKLQKEMESKGLLSRQQSQRMTKKWKDNSVQLMDRVLTAEQSSRSISKELDSARTSAAQQVSSIKASLIRSQSNEKIFAKRLEVVTDELVSTEAALAVCLALLKADPRRNNASHCKDAAQYMEPLRFYSRMRMREDSTMAFTKTP